jgi:hypothetical protein
MASYVRRSAAVTFAGGELTRPSAPARRDTLHFERVPFALEISGFPGASPTFKKTDKGQPLLFEFGARSDVAQIIH